MKPDKNSLIWYDLAFVYDKILVVCLVTARGQVTSVTTHKYVLRAIMVVLISTSKHQTNSTMSRKQEIRLISWYRLQEI